MSITRILPRKLVGPYKLPQLLASLPNSGQEAIIKPTDEKQGIFYLVTRSKLKFLARPKPSSSTSSSSSVGSTSKTTLMSDKVAQSPIISSQASPSIDATEDGIVTAHGMAWGMRFVENSSGCRFAGPDAKSDSKIADPEIRPGKTPWIALDPSTMSLDAQTAIANYSKFRAEYMEKREQLLRERAKVFQERHVARKKERSEAIKRLQEHKAESVKVKILY